MVTKGNLFTEATIIFTLIVSVNPNDHFHMVYYRYINKEKCLKNKAASSSGK